MDEYDEDGTACQSKIRVVVPTTLRFPTLQNGREDLPLLLDLAIAQWFLQEPTIQALGRHDPVSLGKALQGVVSQRPNSHVEARAYEIAAEVLKESAAPWIRTQWTVYRQDCLPRLIQASAACLPFEEAFRSSTNTIQAADQRRIPDLAMSLAHFHSGGTLDWMEAHVHTPVTESWGRLAAVSSLTWERARSWLHRGRPLSLVALDAIAYNYDPPSYRLFPPFLPERPAWPPAEVSTSLRTYEATDNVPRVRTAVERIIQALSRAV